MLADIQSQVQRYAEVISQVTGIDVEVVDDRLIRIAGTGMYEKGVGHSLRSAGEVYRTAMRTRRTVFMETPREHEICSKCPNRAECREKLSVSTPIADGEHLYGVIGLVCFKDDERERVLARKDTFIHFIGLLAQALAGKLHDKRRLEGATEFLDLMLQIVDVNNRGILVRNAEGGFTYANGFARRLLGFDEQDTAPVHLEVLPTGDSFSDMDEFVLRCNGKQVDAVGHLRGLHSRNPDFASVLAFESLEDAKRRVHSLAESGGGEGLDAIVGESAKLKALKAQVQRIATSTSTVLITGESGTGKELFARAIHAESPRREGPFVALNCGAIPDTLLESELFGYVGGAFTGASRKGHIGKFELAHGGVIFLDEIGCMPLYLQVKLLRILQERALTRLGSSRVVSVDIRVIAATNDDLETMVAQNMFREDLYYRLNVIPLRVPPLRDRPGDIRPLVDRFLDTYCARFGKTRPTHIPDRVLELLHAHHWPGNVRELENVVEYMVNMMPGNGRLGPMHLPPALLSPKTATRVSTDRSCAAEPDASPKAVTGHQDGRTTGLTPPGSPPPGMMQGDTADTSGHAHGTIPIMTLQDLERQAIEAALARYGTDTLGKRQAAATLGISVATLYRKLKDAEG